MNRQKLTVFLVVLALIGSAASLLSALKARQRQGKPGLKLVEKPTLDRNANVLRPISVQLPETVLDYTSTNLPIEEIEFKTLPKDTTYGRRSYVKRDGFRSDISVVLMGTDRTSIHKPQICLTGQGWKIEKSELVTIPIELPHPYNLPAMKLTGSKQAKDMNGQLIEGRALYVYWFVAENRLTAEHKERMWGTVGDLVKTGVMPRWAYVSCLSICYPGQEEAVYRRMERLLAAAVPEFQLTTRPAVAHAAEITAAAQ
jgi:hypothetical protein